MSDRTKKTKLIIIYMKKALLIIFFLSHTCLLQAQSSVSLFVGGDLDKFYPVVFQDKGWDGNVPTELFIGRSAVHTDEVWRGSLMAKIVFHNTQWGNGARFTDVDLYQRFNKFNNIDVPFIAGYQDASLGNGTIDFIVWLRGGTTYYYSSNVVQVPVVYDGIKNPLPFMEVNAVTGHNFKTTVEDYVNSFGKSSEGTVYMQGAGLNYLNGDLGLGTKNTRGFKLAVNGKIRAQEIRVEMADWPDYVFEKEYELTPLSELKEFIQLNRHLPGVPKAGDVQQNGVELGEMNKILLKKIEELTLHLISKDEELKSLNKKVDELSAKMTQFTKDK